MVFLNSFDRKYLSLSDVPAFVKEIFGRSRKVHVNTVRRWHDKGVAGVRLETLFVAGERVTTQEDVIRFFEESSKAKQESKTKKRECMNKKQADLTREAKRLGI